MNKGQKISTIIFVMGLLGIFFVLTPWSYNYSGAKVKYGTFFVTDPDKIIYRWLYIEIGLWSVLFLLSLFFFKSTRQR